MQCLACHPDASSRLARQTSRDDLQPRSEYLPMAQVNALSPDGRCKAFDAAADGYGRGEGVAAAVLQPVSKYEEDSGRDMLALLQGSAINQDGRSSSLTVSIAPHLASCLNCYQFDHNQLIRDAALRCMTAVSYTYFHTLCFGSQEQMCLGR